AIDIIERITLSGSGGGSRSGGQRQHESRRQQDERSRDQPLVDGAPPLGDGGGVGAGEQLHGVLASSAASQADSFRFRLLPIPAAICRKASPLCSKSRNWSKLAHAGEKRMTGCSSPEARASA